MENLLEQFPGAAGNTGSAFDVAYYVIISMFILVGITYLFSRFLRNRGLEEWSKNEFIQVLISAAIIGGLVAMMAPNTGVIVLAFDSLVNSSNTSIFIPDANQTSSYAFTSGNIPMVCEFLTGMNDKSTLCFAYNYLGMLELKIINLMILIFQINIILDILSKIAIDIIIVEVTPLSGLSSVVQVLNNILQSLMFLGIIVGVEMALLQFINSVALQVFLPIGAVLRCFFGTRRIGGALMAIAIGMYIIFPLTIAMNALSVEHMEKDAYEPIYNLSSSIKEINPINNFRSEGDLEDNDKWTGFIGKFADVGSKIIGAIASIPEMMTKLISILVVEIVFLPALSVMLTVIAIKELADLLGSEVNLSRFEV
jgi:hypothetical protein